MVTTMQSFAETTSDVDENESSEALPSCFLHQYLRKAVHKKREMWQALVNTVIKSDPTKCMEFII